MAKNPRLVDLSGMKIGEWSIIAQQGNTPRGAALWKCVCSCGVERLVVGADLRFGKSLSCGHVNVGRLGDLKRSHGLSNSRLYTIWQNMHKRCGDPKNTSYGGKGVKVCDEWQAFEPFLAWSKATGYAENLTIDRVSNSLGYCPDNCRWASRVEQAANRDFVAKNAAGELWRHVALRNGITESAYATRVFSGWSYEEAATWPMYKKRTGLAPPRNASGRFTK